MNELINKTNNIHSVSNNLSQDITNIVIKKKRGRKPKIKFNTLCNVLENDDKVISEEEQVILHLPITLKEINNNDIFIKDNSLNNVTECRTISEDNISSHNNSFIYNNINRITTHEIKISSNTKCWWCKNSFHTSPVQLPELYRDNIFYCIGHFCSFNCAKSYNLDINDSSIFKRESLLHLMYNLTYGEYKEITPAPHWLTLEEFGGIFTIEQFRENMISNTKNFIVLTPPVISRQMQIEESYKINNKKEICSIYKISKLYSDTVSDYIIKRSKTSNELNLESTMGLKKTLVK